MRDATSSAETVQWLSRAYPHANTSKHCTISAQMRIAGPWYSECYVVCDQVDFVRSHITIRYNCFRAFNAVGPNALIEFSLNGLGFVFLFFKQKPAHEILL